MKYYDMDWHSDGVTREGLPFERAAVPVGLYMAWIIRAGLVGENHTQESPNDLQAVREGRMTGTEFVVKNCDGELGDGDLTKEGNQFTVAYYNDAYYDDLDSHAPLGLRSLYEFPEGGEFEKALHRTLDRRLEEWRTGKPFSVERKYPWWMFWKR